MKKTLSILFSILSLTLMAQVPQGVGYQGVATDANGIELVNQAISIRASVLSGSATGTIEWEETHATSTDTFGLFTLTIGQGTNTTNGAQTSFADISWGTNTHFLKIEMDVTGGSTYSNMGTNQMMSVPYALFAESANINYDSISNLLSNDSTFITNVGGGMGGGGCDWQFPEGYDGEYLSFKLDASNSYSYIVPSGKRFYITNIYNFSTATNGYISINSNKIFKQINSNTSQYDLHSPYILNQGDLISVQSPNPYDCVLRGFLIDQTNNIIAITETPTNFGSPYIVPAGKKLVITNFNTSGSQIDIFDINGNNTQVKIGYGDVLSLGIPLILESGQSLEGAAESSFNGYLVDENYFAGCGGGGSSSTSSLDSTAIANMITAAGGGCDIEYPEGLDGETIVHDLHLDYTVPAGKNLYINHVYLNGEQFRIDTVKHVFGYVNHRTNISNGANNSNFNIVAGEGQVLSSEATSTGNASFIGFLVDKTTVEPISHSLAGNANGVVSNPTFTVPSNKKLVINHFHNSNFAGTLLVDGIPIHYGEANDNSGNPQNMAFSKYTITLDAGSVISIDHSNECSFNGYLVDENYFAGCGGGGGSSNASAGLDSATVAIMIANAFNSSISTSVGDNFQGGIVGYIFQAGDQGYVPGETHGYILYSDNTDIEWGCMGSVTGVTNPVMGQGQINTDSLVVLCSNTSFAAKWCNEFVIGIYDDWFLPNSEEMLAVGSSFIGNYFGTYQHYWISEEYWQSAPNNSCPSSFCTSADFAFTFYIDGSNSMNLNYVHKEGSPEKVIAFRQF